MNNYTNFYDDDPWKNIKEPCYPNGHRLFLNDDRFWVSMNSEGQICFFVHDEFVGDLVIPENLAGVKIEQVKYTGNKTRLICSLTSNDPDLINKFSIVAKDIAYNSEGLKGATLFNNVVHLIRSWANFLKPQRNGLTESEYIGFWGELYTFAELILSQIPLSEAIRFWVGPEGKKQDFTLNNLAIEVKTSFSSEARKLTISSLEQLDQITEKLYILHIVANPSETSSGYSLKDLYEMCRQNMNGDLQLELTFLQKVNDLYGNASERQLTDKNLVISETLYEINDSFPALRTEDIPNSIVSLRYDLLVSAIKEFVCTESIKKVIKHG
jgi:hypothetical protein